ncbi:hypothetical protein Syun_019259 [Stephania yunnanensis]|uniref:Uncharacterized protein n=1 Tax=Stephania yunnanensis TaxID=152371 RepID=A0AAP0NVR5_9MAGN
MASESVGVHASEYQSHSRYRRILCEGLEMIREKRGMDGRGKEINLKAYDISTTCGVYGASVRWTSAEDEDRGLVMHRDKDMDMFHLDRDFNVSVWALWTTRYSRARNIFMLLPRQDVALAYINGRRQMVCSLLGSLGGAQLVAEEPSPTE